MVEAVKRASSGRDEVEGENEKNERKRVPKQERPKDQGSEEEKEEVECRSGEDEDFQCDAGTVGKRGGS